MGMLTLFPGLVLPWALGIASLLAARDTRERLDGPGELAWLIGAGYLFGAVALTLWMRVLSIAGVHFGVGPIAVPLVAVTLALGYAAWRRHGGKASGLAADARKALSLPPEFGGSTRALWHALLAWIALRFVLLGFEVGLRPLYPWDAWIEWATKARVWFEVGTMAPFVDAGQWLAANSPAWFDASPGNPATLPLLQVWACLSLGRWDDVLMNWPWWQIAVALALIVYGGLRRLGFGPLAALFGTYFTASLPLANVHVALAGYADLPLAACYTGAVLAFLRWLATRTLRDAVMVLLFATTCPLVKSTGTIHALTLLPGIAIALMPRQGRKFVAAGFGIVLFALAVLAQTNLVLFGRSLHLEFAPVWSALAESYFVAGNWNLLWFGVIGAALLAWRELRQPALLAPSSIVAAGMLFVLIVFAFPGIGWLLTDAPTFNRATLPLAPVLIVFMLLAFRAFSGRWSTAYAPRAPSPESAVPDHAGATATAN